jgi:hypothetical protein
VLRLSREVALRITIIKSSFARFVSTSDIQRAYSFVQGSPFQKKRPEIEKPEGPLVGVSQMVENLTFDEKQVFVPAPKAGLADEQTPPVFVDLNREK